MDRSHTSRTLASSVGTGGADDRLTAWVKTVDPTAAAALGYGYNLPETEEKAAAWLEWAPKWHEAGRP